VHRSLILWVGLALIAPLPGCSLSRAALGTGGDAQRADSGPPRDVGVDAGMDAGPDSGADGGPDAFVPDTGMDAFAPDMGTDAFMPDMGTDAFMPRDMGTDAFTPDAGPIFPTLPGITLLLDERGISGSGRLGTWPDHSSRGNDFLQVSASRQPAATGLVSSWNAASFDGTDFLNGSTNWDSLFGTMGGRLWIVIDNTGETPGPDAAAAAPYDEDALVSCESSGGINVSWSASGPRAYGYNGAECVTPRIVVSPGRHLVEVGYDGSTFSLRVDAWAGVSTPCSGPLALFGTTAHLGTNWNTSRDFVGRIAMVVAINRVPTGPEIQAMRDFITAKYGVPT
jgi:hypothetical protein